MGGNFAQDHWGLVVFREGNSFLDPDASSFEVKHRVRTESSPDANHSTSAGLVAMYYTSAHVQQV